MAVLTDEQRELRDLARDFATGEIRPSSLAWDAAASLPDELFDSLAEVGFLGLRAPEEQGGLGLGLLSYLVILEELAWGDAAVARSVALHGAAVTGILAALGSDQQKEAWLPRLASGEVLGALALAEDGEYGGPEVVRCRATSEAGESWRLTGSKGPVVDGERAGLVLVVARPDASGDAAGSGGVGCFLVDPASDGYTVARRRTTMGFRASQSVDLALEGVAAEALGSPTSPGAGTAVLEALDATRLGMAAVAVGVARAAMEHALGYALEREQFGQPLADFGAIQEKLAGMAGRIGAARSHLHHAAARVEEGGAGDGAGDTPRAAAALARITASEAAMWVADEAVQIYGGYGYMRDYPVEKLMRDAKGTEIQEGTNESLRSVVAREILPDTRTGAP